mmetsp:Transcript_74729/g.118914  ORF Transcript_74729/g.118914 Transcript_74729/m.118914 type:complete len:115 (-) Transcript_74729:179-523(-)|eukprot:CAMPEP_0197020996 /NCGR_PEP_ID=MMETSP1384-20130603/1882_1 /TAXON_ID=29189 /ORGANISM="Ammonia sp." /LENGTH=114 /DNA_ID=CAMNT_0042448735 /DNA_START=66 /DNA_END=410 /DNA_ORIENTATION=+
MSYELPTTAVQKIIHRVNPDVKVKKDAKQAISKAAGIFVLYLAHNANQLCKNAKRSTIQADDVLNALQEIEFGEFNDELRKTLDSWREEQQQIKESKKQKKENAKKAASTSSTS